MTDETAFKNPYDVQLLLLPGLGGDHRMAYRQLALPYECITPDYIPINAGESVAAYTARFAEYLDRTFPIDHGRPLFIAGYSFGSTVAQELSRIWPSRGVILIGGLRSGLELRPFIRWFGRHIAAGRPQSFYSRATAAIRFVMNRVSDLSAKDLELCIDMYMSFPPGMFGHAYRALAEWGGCSVPVPMLRIHGERDQIIRRLVKSQWDIIIPLGKHLIGMSRPEIVNRALEAFITDVLRKRGAGEP